MINITRRRIRAVRYALFAVFVVLTLDLFLSYQSSYPHISSVTTARDLTGLQSVYIASTQWNSGKLLQEHWIPSLLQVVKGFKDANIAVFVSIYENGSWDDTKSILRQLRQTLEDSGVRHEIVIDDTSHEQVIANARAQNASDSGWLKTAYGKEMRRISYLAKVRNKALKPLARLNEEGITFDRVLYINDVVFSVSLFDSSLGISNG